MTASLPWQCVWVTGASSGIGKALVIALCEAGANVIATARSEDALMTLQAQLCDAKGDVIVAALDMTQPSAVTALISQWQQDDTWPDLAILNAGTHDPFGIEALTAERVKRLFDINVFGTLHCFSPLLAHYTQQNRGHIAVMASVAGYRGLPTASAYGATKAALIHLCESLYFDLQHSAVRLQVINPGFVRTPLTDRNQFSMPARLEPEQAAEAIIAGLQTHAFEITFPRRFVFWLKLFRLLPYRWYFSWITRLTRQ